MKRSPMKRRVAMRRGAPLARRTRIKPRRSTPRRSTRVRDPEFLAFIHSDACPMWCVVSLPGHRCKRGTLAGIVEGDHQGPRGTSQKADDNTTVKLCKLIHVVRDSFVGAEFRSGGVFAGWGRAEMQAWIAKGIRYTQEAYERHRGARLAA